MLEILVGAFFIVWGPWVRRFMRRLRQRLVDRDLPGQPERFDRFLNGYTLKVTSWGMPLLGVFVVVLGVLSLSGG